jgi:DNA-binding HxlR family transcriptional regulator
MEASGLPLPSTNGLVKQTQYQEILPRVEYELTELANRLEPIFSGLEKWGNESREIISEAQVTYDKRKA